MLEFMLGIFRTAVGHFGGFNGSGMHMALFFAALLYLIAVKREEEEGDRKLIVGYSILFAILYLCPVTAYIIMEYCIGTSVYWRMFWLLPTIIVTSYVFVKWLFSTRGRGQFALFFAVAAVVIVVTGAPVYTQENFSAAENAYKIPQNAIDICELIEQDRGEGTAKVTVPNELLCYIRQYDASIRMPYGRNALTGQRLGERRTQIYEMMTSGNIDWERMIQLLKDEKSNYFVYPAGIGVEELESGGYTLIGDVNGYSIYNCKDME